jgi:hypothetical protein
MGGASDAKDGGEILSARASNKAAIRRDINAHLPNCAGPF